MLIVSYDISDDKKRTKFSKYLSRFGYRLQYSVFAIKNSDKILDNIISDLDNKFSKLFNQSDSIYIIKLNPNCEIKKYGYAANEDENLIIF